MIDKIAKAYFFPFVLMLKIFLWAAVLAAVVGVIFLLTFDLNSFRSEIEKTASSFLKDELKINGDISLSAENFRPSLVLHDVKVGQDGKTTVMLADRVEVTIPLGKPDKNDPWAFFADLENVRIDGKRFGDYDIPIRFHRDGFEIPDVRGELDDGILSGHAKYQEGKLEAVLELKDLDYSHVAEGVTGGDTKADIQLTAHGKEYADLVRTLNGRVFVVGGAGEIAGGAVDLWAADLLTSILRGPEKETRLNCAVADFNIVNGIATAKTVILDTDRVTIFGKGRVNLITERIDMVFTPKPKESSLVSLATPVKVQGPLQNIRAIPDEGAMVKKLGGLLLGVINPAAAILPMMEKGTGNKNPCMKYLQ